MTRHRITVPIVKVMLLMVWAANAVPGPNRALKLPVQKGNSQSPETMARLGRKASRIIHKIGTRTTSMTATRTISTAGLDRRVSLTVTLPDLGSGRGDQG